MEDSIPHVHSHVTSQLSQEAELGENLKGDDSQQVSSQASQSFYNFLPPLYDNSRGSMTISSHHGSHGEVSQGEDSHPTAKVNDSNFLSYPFPLSHHLQSPVSKHIGSGDKENPKMMQASATHLETRSESHHFQAVNIFSSSHIFGENVECDMFSDIVPLNAAPPYESALSKKHMGLSDDLARHTRENPAEVADQSKSPQDQMKVCDVQDGTENIVYEGNTVLPSSSADKIGSLDFNSSLESSSQEDTFNLNVHMQQAIDKVEEATSWACSFCPKVCRTHELLVKHEALHPYNTSAIQCSKCREILGNYLLLQEHRQYEDYLSSCDICGELFPNEECMVCHIRNAHSDIAELLEEENIFLDVQANTASEDTLPNFNAGDESVVMHTPEERTDSICDHLPGSDSELSRAQPRLSTCLEALQQCEAVNEEETVGERDEPYICLTPVSESEEKLCKHSSARESPLLEKSYISESSPKNLSDQSLIPDNLASPVSKKMKCQFCSKKCSSRKSLIRHERCHPYGTSAMKCNLCLEIVDNYKALKAHKKSQGASVSCSTCNQICPNDKCLSCHLRNVHNNSVYEVKHSFSDEDEHDSDGDNPSQRYSVSRYTVRDSGAPLRITIKQEKEEVYEIPDSPTFSASTPPTPPTPSNRGPLTPSPQFIYESEHSDAQDDNIYEPYTSDQSDILPNGRTARRKVSVRATRKSSLKSTQLLYSSDESDNDESGDFNYDPQSYSESEDNSDNAKWTKAESPLGTTKRKTRRSNPVSDDSDNDPDWGGTKRTSAVLKKKGRKRKGPLSDDSENDLDWGPSKSYARVTRKKTGRKKGTLSDSDDDPEWRHGASPPEDIKKKPTGKRGRRKRLQVAFFLPAIPVPKVKRPRARGLGGQKAQDAAAALAQAIADMETSVPELKTVIKPVRRSVTKASLKRFHDIEDDDYNYLVDVKSEPKDDKEQNGSVNETSSNQDCVVAANNLESGSEHNDSSFLNSDTPSTDQQEEQIVIKAEPYDFQDDEASQSADFYFSRKFCENNPNWENSTSPENKLEHNTGVDVKKELRYPCKYCGRAMQYRSHLVRHLRRVHGGEGVEEVMRRLMKCRFCDKPYSNELSLINHEKLHDGTSKMKCNKCEERFDDKNALRRHQRKTHWEHQPVECDICKKQLSDNTCLKAHMKHMHGSDEKKVTIFTCESCGRQLHTKTAFQNHVASKCGTNLLFPCETCGKSFSFKGSLKAHQLLHSGVKSFLCKFCGKAFHQKGEMKRHERKHTGEKPFVCEVCGRAFAYRESLLGHSAVHTGIKPFPCKACGMRFSCSGNLVKHRRSNNCRGPHGYNENVPINSVMENIGTVQSGDNSTIESGLGSMCSVSEVGGNVNANMSVGPSSSILSDASTKSSQINSSLEEVVSPSVETHHIMNEPLAKKKDSVSIMAHEVQSQVEAQAQVQNQTQSLAHAQVLSQAQVPSQVEQMRLSNVASNPNLTISPVSSVIKSTPSIHVKPASALQAVSKDVKSTSHVNVSQTYGVSSNLNTRMTSHLNPIFSNQESSLSMQSSYNSQTLSSPFSENNFRQVNPLSISDRRFGQFNMEGLAGRSEQYFDRQSLMRHEMSRQVMERTVDRQTSRFLDWTGGVQFSGVDSRAAAAAAAAMQSYPTASIPHAPAYPNIHSGLGNYSASNHTSNHANLYGGAANAMMAGAVSFPPFGGNNPLSMGYSHNNTIPAHSAHSSHSGAYPAPHMSHLEALFGHLSHPGGTANPSFPRLSTHNVGSSNNPSYPNNHRV